MAGFRIDEEQALNYMTRQDFGAAQQGGHTVYAVMCHHGLDDGVGSHGGFIVPNAREAIDRAQKLNDTVPEDHACRYVPVAVSLMPTVADEIMHMMHETPPDDK